MMVHKKRDETVIDDEVPTSIYNEFPVIDENIGALDKQKEVAGQTLLDFRCEVCGKNVQASGIPEKTQKRS